MFIICARFFSFFSSRLADAASELCLQGQHECHSALLPDWTEWNLAWSRWKSWLGLPSSEDLQSVHGVEAIQTSPDCSWKRFCRRQLTFGHWKAASYSNTGKALQKMTYWMRKNLHCFGSKFCKFCLPAESSQGTERKILAKIIRCCAFTWLSAAETPHDENLRKGCEGISPVKSTNSEMGDVQKIQNDTKANVTVACCKASARKKEFTFRSISKPS